MDLPVIVRRLGRVDYFPTWQAMQTFTARRQDDTPDELWLLEHPPVFTLGQAGRRCHLVAPGEIPVVATDRGGQVTYHGPGQAIAYVLLDLRRRGYGVRELVTRLEQAVIDLLADFGLTGQRREHMPGVYVDGRKIAALGLRIRQGKSYHGLALNVDMDLAPFRRIHPCGYPDLEVTQLSDLGVETDLAAAEERLAAKLLSLL